MWEAHEHNLIFIFSCCTTTYLHLCTAYIQPTYTYMYINRLTSWSADVGINRHCNQQTSWGEDFGISRRHDQQMLWSADVVISRHREEKTHLIDSQHCDGECCQNTSWKFEPRYPSESEVGEEPFLAEQRQMLQVLLRPWQAALPQQVPYMFNMMTLGHWLNNKTYFAHKSVWSKFWSLSKWLQKNRRS